MKNRLREKLSDYNPPTITSPPPINNNISSQPPRVPSLASNDGGRSGNHENSTSIKPPVAPRPVTVGLPTVGIYRETNGGTAMHLKSGTVNGGNESDSE